MDLAAHETSFGMPAKKHFSASGHGKGKGNISESGQIDQ